MQKTEQMNSTPKNWPFPVSNGVRNKESQELIDSKNSQKTKDDLSDLEEALL